MKRTLSEIEKVLSKSRVALPSALKLRVADLILHLMARKKRFGLFVILGWRNRWRAYTDISDASQDIFAYHHINITNAKHAANNYREISATVRFDGAILIDCRGTVRHSGVIIEGLRPRLVAEKLNPGRFPDLSAQFGFRRKVHTRHLSAITASYVFKNTTVYTVSEEDDSFHIFEKGGIVWEG